MSVRPPARAAQLNRGALGRRLVDKRARRRLLLLVAVLGCARDRSITKGAENQHEWSRRLSAAVPVGTVADTARATLERNGSQCQATRDTVDHLQCEKESKGLVIRRWKALLNLDHGRVVEVHALLELIGP